MEKLFEKPFGSVVYEPEHNICYLAIVGSPSFEEYKMIWLTGLDHATKRSSRRIIVDLSKMQKSGIDSKAWLVTSYLPKARKALGDNLKIAVLYSKSLFARIGTDYVVSAVKAVSRIEFKFVNSIEEAHAWIIQI
ncbi:MAG: hypothetical protein NZ551_00710 [Microscillaceae bacterium]|nr:hypothetical protein [Microscillaceae bacterium]MDW8459709.1 hypothetical protein [Cytophagales bacterium]